MAKQTLEERKSNEGAKVTVNNRSAKKIAKSKNITSVPVAKKYGAVLAIFSLLGIVSTTPGIYSNTSTNKTVLQHSKLSSSTNYPGYLMLTQNGGILSFGGSPLYGSMGNQTLSSPIAAMAVDPAVVTGPNGLPTTSGYWLTNSQGDVFPFGGAPNYGSTAGIHLNKPIVGMVSTPNGGGYWLVASDGGIFSFGNAKFYGSTGGMRLNKPIVGIASTPNGGGYWLVASDGGIFSFGNAKFYGSTGGMRLNKPVLGMASTPNGGGYWLVASDGGIFSFGNAQFYGSTGGMRLNKPIVGMTTNPNGGGYWLVASDGGIFSFGDAPFRGSAGGTNLLSPVMGMSVTTGVGTAPTAEANSGIGPYTSATTGYDISWPQCGGNYPSTPYNAAIVGVNYGSAFTTNPCLASEAAWAGNSRSLYINLNAPTGYSQGNTGPAGTCSSSDLNCQSYNYGYNAAISSMQSASSQGIGARTWWLDVETGNNWGTPNGTIDTAANAQVVAGAIAALQSHGMVVGIYSTHYQFTTIVGNYSPNVPMWVPTGVTLNNPSTWCQPGPYHEAFTSNSVWMVQYSNSTYDQDYAC